MTVDKDKPPTIEFLLGQDAPTEPRRRRGRPTLPIPETFEQALAQLTPMEGEFVRAVVGGLSNADAYRSAHPTANAATAATGGSRFASHKMVRHAIRLGKGEIAKELRLATRYDLEAAHRELESLIAQAIKANQFSAVANLVREKLKMHKLTDSKEAVAQAGFSIIIHAADGSTHVAGASEQA